VYQRSAGVLITTDRERIAIDAVEAFLRQTYWAARRTRERIARTLETSLCFAALDETSGSLIGFARVVTDYADFAWLCDVFVAPERRGEGIAKLLVESVLAHPELQGLRRMILATSSAHGLYERYGFTPLANPQLWMERGPNPR
jgi:GNAT superfamily N-acetyltransferase